MQKHKIPNSERSKLFITDDIAKLLYSKQPLPGVNSHYNHFFQGILETISAEFPQAIDQIKANSEEKGLSGIAMIVAYGNLNGHINVFDGDKELPAQEIIDSIDKKARFGGIILQIYKQGSLPLVIDSANQQLTSDNAVIVLPEMLIPFGNSDRIIPGETFYRAIEPGRIIPVTYKKPVKQYVDNIVK